MTELTWVEHRREDGELLGWIRPEGEGFVPVTLLGRDLTGPTDWLVAEEALESLGLGWLAERWSLRLEDGSLLQVRITEVSRGRIVVKKDDFGAINAPLLEYRLPFPAPDELQPLADGRY